VKIALGCPCAVNGPPGGAGRQEKVEDHRRSKSGRPGLVGSGDGSYSLRRWATTIS